MRFCSFYTPPLQKNMLLVENVILVTLLQGSEFKIETRHKTQLTDLHFLM